MKSLHKIDRNIRKKTNRKGFTFIELLTVFAIVAILTSLSIAGFSKFNQSKSFDNSVNDVATMLSTARSRSLSQVKKCTTGILNGYLVTVQNTGPAPYKYELDYVCNGTSTPVDTEYLPNTVQFTSGSMCNTLYITMTGTSNPTGSITLKDTVSGKQAYLAISSTGTITRHTGTGPNSPCLTLAQLLSSGPTPTPAPTSTPAPTPTPTPAPHPLGAGGGMDLYSYCQNVIGSTYFASYNAGTNQWYCQNGAQIDLLAECKWQYPGYTYYTVHQNIPPTNTWDVCYGY